MLVEYQEAVWMKSSIFDFIIYKIIMSVPVSIIINLVYGVILFLAVYACRPLDIFYIREIREMLTVVLYYIIAIVPFTIFNLIRYIAIRQKKLGYGICGLIFSSIPEYMFMFIIILGDMLGGSL